MVNGLKQCINHRSFLLTTISIPISLIFYFWHGKEKIVKSSRVYFECSISQVNDDHSITVAVPPIWISHLGPIGKSTRMMTMMIGEGYKIVITVRSPQKRPPKSSESAPKTWSSTLGASQSFLDSSHGALFPRRREEFFLNFRAIMKLNAHVITR